MIIHSNTTRQVDHVRHVLKGYYFENKFFYLSFDDSFGFIWQLKPNEGLFLIIILLDVDSLVFSADPWCSLGILMISKKETVRSDQETKEIF